MAQLLNFGDRRWCQLVNMEKSVVLSFFILTQCHHCFWSRFTVCGCPFYLNTVGSTDGQYCFQLCFGVFFLSMNTITDLAEIFKEC